jgi:uncharacterized protein YbjQ (UPF0145 family)
MQWTDVVGVAVGVITILAAILAGLFWLIRSVVRQEIERYTKTIQPGYRNGGSSLSDIAAKLDDISNRL